MNKEKIAELQNMLRYIGEKTDTAAFEIAVNGQYDAPTKSAVAIFKRQNNIATNDSTVDERTWNAITTEYGLLKEVHSVPMGLSVFPEEAGYTVARGEISDLVLIIQMLLNELKYYYDGYDKVQTTGRFDADTESAVAEFQRVNRLYSDGRIDKQTWNKMAAEYNSLQRKFI